MCDNIDGIDDSEVFLVYSSTSQLLFVNEPITPIVANTFGGDVRTWEIWPFLPPGLTLNGETARSTTSDGTISGAPMAVFDMQVFTVWANNSQYSSAVEITLQSVVPDPDDSDFDMIYLVDFMNLTTDLDEAYLEPEIFGGNITSWSISPQLPEGLDFNTTNGLITGVVVVELNATTFTISASNSLFLHTHDITISAKLLDTDGDGIPDVTDEDDDGDGWTDVTEEECGADPLDITSKPDDYDGDGICDLTDEFDDSPIVFFYASDRLELTVGLEMEPLEPRIAPSAGGIIGFSVVPDLPPGLSMNNTTGMVSGTPTEPYDHLVLEYSHMFTAVNGQNSFSYTVDFVILAPIIENPDSDKDGWSDSDELECDKDPFDSVSFPEDIDLDLICSHIDEDDDGDKIGDLIDAFPKDPTAWDDTDSDGMPDELTCKYSTDSTNCTPILIEDIDDDNDGWIDLNETSCATDPKDNLSIPADEDGDGVCDLLEDYVPPAVRILWICCVPILLLLLLLLWLLNPFEVEESEIMGPEPQFSSTERGWIGGSGKYDDPFVLREVAGVKPGSFAESHEIIKITNITPRLMCDFVDMTSEENGSRFSMRGIKSSSRGEVEFRLQFRDDQLTSQTTTYESLIRFGKATVYFLWSVEVEVTKDTPEEVIAKKKAAKIEREAKRKAAEAEERAREAEWKASRIEREAAQKAARIEREATEKASEATEKAAGIEREAAQKASEAAQKAAEIEFEATEKAAEIEFEAIEKAAEAKEAEELEEQRAAEEKAKMEAEERSKEAGEKAAEIEREAAEAKAMLRKKAERRKAAEAEERARENSRKAAEKEAREEIEREAEREAAEIERKGAEKASRIEREKAEKASRIEREKAEKAAEAKKSLRKKAEERRRKLEEEERGSQEARKKAAAREEAMEEEIAERRSKLEGLAEEERRKEKALLRVAERMNKIDFGIIGFATHADKDDLEEIEGIGTFIEEKLNSLGIYKFSQISRMDSDLEDKVNEAIEFFPGRVKRDRWVDQAKVLAASPQEPAVAGESAEMEHEAAEARAMLRKKAERRKSREMAERALAEAQRREAEELVRKKAEERKRLEEEGRDILDEL